MSDERFAVDGWDTAKKTPVGNEQFDTWADVDASGNVLTRRLFGAGFDDVVARLQGGVVSWYGTDRQGSVRQVFDNSGGVVASSDFDAWGNVTAGALTDRYGFTGLDWDGFARLWMPANGRPYDADIGRWLAGDEKGFAAGDVNLSRYVGNGPTNGVDPSGYWLYIPEGDRQQWKQFVDAGYIEFSEPENGHARINVLGFFGRSKVFHDGVVQMIRDAGIADNEGDQAVRHAMSALFNGHVDMGTPEYRNYDPANDRILVSQTGTPGYRLGLLGEFGVKTFSAAAAREFIYTPQSVRRASPPVQGVKVRSDAGGVVVTRSGNSIPYSDAIERDQIANQVELMNRDPFREKEERIVHGMIRPIVISTLEPFAAAADTILVYPAEWTGHDVGKLNYFSRTYRAAQDIGAGRSYGSLKGDAGMNLALFDLGVDTALMVGPPLTAKALTISRIGIRGVRTGTVSRRFEFGPNWDGGAEFIDAPHNLPGSRIDLFPNEPAQNIAGLTVGQARELEAKILQSIPGAQSVWVFGSRTKGKSTSDIDILVVGTFDEGPNKIRRGQEKVQDYAKKMGIPRPEGKPNNPRIDFNFDQSTDAFIDRSRKEPNFDPSRWPPNLKRME